MDLLKSYQMLDTTTWTLKDIIRKFFDVYKKAKYFWSSMNVIFENEDTIFRVEKFVIKLVIVILIRIITKFSWRNY